MKVLRQQSHTIFLSSFSPDIDDNHVKVASYFQFVTETVIPPTLLLQSLHRVLTKFILSFSLKIDTHMVTNYSLSYFQNLACQFHFFRGKFKKQTKKRKTYKTFFALIILTPIAWNHYRHSTTQNAVAKPSRETELQFGFRKCSFQEKSQCHVQLRHIKNTKASKTMQYHTLHIEVC